MVFADCVGLSRVFQVGAASRALCGARSEQRGAVVRCASLKSNMGHLEAAAAAAGLSSLVAGPLLAGVVAVNAQLRRLVCKASRSGSEFESLAG